MINVEIKIKTDNDFLKTKYQEDRLNHPSDAGLDLYCPERIVCIGDERTTIDLEVKIQAVGEYETVEEKLFDDTDNDGRLYKDVGYEYTHYLMLPRSSFSKSTLLLCNSVGVIDKDYVGSLKAVVYNFSRHNYVIEKGDRLFQLIFPIFHQINDVRLVDSLSITKRNEAGFGSTGK